MNHTYFEDLTVGERDVSPAMTLTQAHVDLYRGFGGDLTTAVGQVPDLIPLCLVTGLGWRLARPPLAVLAFIGIDWKIVSPVSVGDTVHTRMRTAAKRALRDAGVVVQEQEVVDQRGAVVQQGRFSFLVARRPGKETSHDV